jgi:hypothetical protein
MPVIIYRGEDDFSTEHLNKSFTWYYHRDLVGICFGFDDLSGKKGRYCFLMACFFLFLEGMKTSFK